MDCACKKRAVRTTSGTSVILVSERSLTKIRARCTSIMQILCVCGRVIARVTAGKGLASDFFRVEAMFAFRCRNFQTGKKYQ
eukprot:SAG11_NODE_825_length_6992_cov_2.298564_2_plen_82_part_00